MTTLRSTRELLGSNDWRQTPWWWFLAALLGFTLAWRRPTMRYTACMFLFYFFMMTYHSRPLWALGHPVLKYLQFSWRSLSVLATIGYLGIVQLGFPLLRLYARSRQHAGVCVCIACAVACGALLSAGKPFHLVWMVRWQNRLAVFDYDRVMRQNDLTTLVGQPEFMPKLARPERFETVMPMRSR